MVKRNPHLAKLHSGYLFPEIAKRVKFFLEHHPDAQLISLGIGDTTEPIPHMIVEGFKKKAEELGTVEGYSGYGKEQGLLELRQQISQHLYQNKIDPTELFISDGSKCDIGRLQVLFGHQSVTAVQDPTYPVYVDTSVILGQTTHYNRNTSHYEGIVYLPCNPDNDFFPDLSPIPKGALIYFCSPNNPTGATATREQLNQLVAFAKKNQSIIIYDAAYSIYIQDPTIPRSIYEIEGARDVAIELGSFSKMVGFTGVRLAWNVVPKELLFEEGHSVHQDWSRMSSTFFNGASNIAQAGGVAALTPKGISAMQELVKFYMANTRMIKSALEELGYQVYGGQQAPYVWVKTPYETSWKAFEEILKKAHLICTPGSGFGPSGEGFVRFSAFGHRHHIEEAISRLNKMHQ